MLIAFQIVLLIIAIFSFLLLAAEGADKELRNYLTTLCIISIMLLFGTVAL